MTKGNLLALFRNITISSYEKGEILIKAGTLKKEVFFIRKGLIRSYYTNDELEEITFQLYPEFSAFINIHAVLFDEPSKFAYQALEKTKVYKMDHASFVELAINSPKLLDLNRKYIGKRAMKEAFQRVESFVFLSAEERYEKYVKDHPNIINRAPDKYIANVLGITPVSLSRIRSRIVSKRK